MRERWDAKNNSRDYGIARNLGSGLRDSETLLGTLWRQKNVAVVERFKQKSMYGLSAKKMWPL